VSLQTVFLILVALYLFWQMHERHAQKHRCHYCGVVGSHEPDCPWNLEREERP
jgi:hypothetical protein